jgi:hypothetical protein
MLKENNTAIKQNHNHNQKNKNNSHFTHFTRLTLSLDEFYENYKNNILNKNQEKFLSQYKDNIYKLNELEILVARYEKFDDSSSEFSNNYNLYISKAKEVK